MRLLRLSLDTGTRDREAETQPALPGQSDQSGPAQLSNTGPAPGCELGARAHKTAAEISVSLSAQNLGSESWAGDSHGLPGTEYLLTRDWSTALGWGQECAILWYSVVTKIIQAAHNCTHTHTW